ncbi:MAG: hypothetical protein OSA98_13670, partial [Rubripirellula sp.]|nr:hypothetical protein [Rubripirellula sp.]
WSGPRMVWAPDGLGLENIDHLIAVIDFPLSKQKREPESDQKSTLEIGSCLRLLSLMVPVDHDAIRNAIHVANVGSIIEALRAKDETEAGDESFGDLAMKLLEFRFFANNNRGRSGR